MIELMRGNLLKADAEALVNTVNTDGVMGKGVALQFKKAFPDMFKEYRKACKSGAVTVGKMHVFERGSLMGPRFIINFPTKKNWREPSKLEYVKEGLNALVEDIKKLNIRSVAIPPLGCGFGGLKWDDVYPLIRETFERLPDVRFLAENPDIHADSRARLAKVVELIEGFESPYGMELLATVHWIAAHECSADDEESAIRSVHNWNERKRKMMKPEHIRVAWRRLKAHGWINGGGNQHGI